MGIVFSCIRAMKDMSTIETASLERIQSILHRMACRFVVMLIVYTASFVFITLDSHVLKSLSSLNGETYTAVYVAFYGVFIVSMLLDVALVCPRRGAVHPAKLTAASVTCIVSAVSYLTCKALVIAPYFQDNHMLLTSSTLALYLALTLFLVAYKVLCAIILHRIRRRFARTPPAALAAQGATAPMLGTVVPGNVVPITPTQADPYVVVGVPVQS